MTGGSDLLMTGGPGEWEWRCLLSQPVYRYGRSDGDVADGAIFAFCKGTNPEVLLLLLAKGSQRSADSSGIAKI